jgi:hypothetical protein
VLESLNQYQSSKALGVLSELASSLIPEPLVEGEHRAAESFSFKHEDVLLEIRRHIGLAQDDYSDEARDKILAFIAEQIKQIVLGRADEGAIKNRLADKGLLRPDLYEVTFEPNFGRVLERGIRRNHVHQALNYSDDTEHIELDNATFKDQGSASFYVKHYIDEEEASRNFSLLVVTNRKGYRQMVADAVRVYPADVDIADVSRPLDFFRAFVQKYGNFVEVCGYREKLFLFASIEKPKVIHDDLWIKADKPNGTDPRLCVVYASTAKTIEIVIAYAIDENRYRVDLKKRGVNLS